VKQEKKRKKEKTFDRTTGRSCSGWERKKQT